MRRASRKEIEAILRLDGPARFSHFVKRVADAEEAWGLWSDGWALMATSEGAGVFPLWPGAEYAELVANGEWAEFEPAEIALANLLGELLPSLARDGVRPGVFPTPANRAVTPAPEELIRALRAELERYY